MEVKIISLDDDLEKIVSDINAASWDDANEISEYTVNALKSYLQREDTIFLVCYETSPESSTLLGIASSRIEIKPYSEQLWLYVDELDVCTNQRRKGVGKFIMQNLIKIATDEGCKELWLGTETDNLPANMLYKSLKPDEVLQFIGYAYETGP